MGDAKTKSINERGLSKTEFARYVSDRMDLPITYCKQSLNLVLNGILMATEEGYDLCFNGFGSFTNRRREPFIQRSPMLRGESEGCRKAVVPAVYCPHFTPATTYKEVAKNYGESVFGKNDTTCRKGIRKTDKLKEL